jgi:O-antigen/teichoic acid export membrane protein
MRRWFPGPVSPIWVAAETLSAALLSLFGLLFIARLIGPHEAGIGAMAASVFLTLDFPISALFGDSLLQRRDLEERHRSSALWTTLAIALAGVALLCAAAPLVAAATGVPRLAPMIQALSLLLPASAVSGMLSAMALRDRRYRLLAARVLLCQPVAVGTGVAAAALGYVLGAAATRARVRRPVSHALRPCFGEA